MRVKTLAGEKWSKVAPDLLKNLQTCYGYDGIRILMAEARIDQMITLLEQAPWIHGEALKKAVAASIGWYNTFLSGPWM